MQIAKLSMIPTVCILEWILHGKTYSKEVKTAVFVVMIGVGICTVTDVKVNLGGFTAACVAVICTSLQQIVSNLKPVYLVYLYSINYENFCLTVSLFDSVLPINEISIRTSDKAIDSRVRTDYNAVHRLHAKETQHWFF